MVGGLPVHQASKGKPDSIDLRPQLNFVRHVRSFIRFKLLLHVLNVFVHVVQVETDVSSVAAKAPRFIRRLDEYRRDAVRKLEEMRAAHPSWQASLPASIN
jgi:hypothetical protein